MNDYLIPANSKQSILILGLFKPFDLILFLSGVAVTIVLLLLIPINSLTMAILILLPALVCGVLVMPIPNYHNVLTVIKEIWEFFNTRRNLVWRGWCVNNGKDDEI